MKKALFFVLALAMVFQLAACGNNVAQTQDTKPGQAPDNTVVSDPYPEKNIDFVIPAAAGGGMETSVRQFQPYAESELGVNFNIEAVEGGSGIIGINRMLSTPADGYTISIKSEASLICNWLLNDANFGIDDFDYLCSFTTDPGAIFVRKDAPYQTLTEFVEYTKTQPAGSVTVALSTSTDMCHLLAVQMEEALGVDWNVVGYSGGSKARLAVVNGEVDALFCNYFGCASIWEDCTVLGIAKDENTIESLKDVPTINDALGINVDEIDVRYVLLAPKGFMEKYPERYENLYNSLCKAWSNPEFLKMMGENGMAEYIYVQDAETTTAEMKAYDELLAKYADILGA